MVTNIGEIKMSTCKGKEHTTKSNLYEIVFTVHIQVKSTQHNRGVVLVVKFIQVFCPSCKVDQGAFVYLDIL